MNKNKCHVCNLAPTKIEGIGPLERKTFVECPRCGKYIITDMVTITTYSEHERAKIIAWVRDFQERGMEPPELNTKTIKNITDNLPNYTPSQKQLILMKNIERRTKYPGYVFKLFPNNDFPLAWASCTEELIYYISTLDERRLLKATKLIGPAIEPQSGKLNALDMQISEISVEILSDGWEYLELNSRHSVISDQAFVAMSFSGNIDSAYENAIKKAIEAAGYQSFKVGDKPHNERIDVKIMAEIKNSRFLIADVTEQKHGVYFEAGYALGLGIPVIWSCRHDDLVKVHFDTRQYNHIVWQTEEKLKEDLYNYICAIIGKNKGQGIN